MNHKDLLNHPRHKKISFVKDTHKYYYTDESAPWKDEFKGATSLISQFCETFDRDGISKGVAYKRGITQEEVLAEWDEGLLLSQDEGNGIHGAAEQLVLTGEWDDEYNGELTGFTFQMELFGLEPVTSELVIYDEDIQRASAIDIVAYDPAAGEYVIVDIKTWKDGITYTGYKDKKMLYPLRHVPDSKYHKACVQTSIYRRWMTDKYNLPFSENNYILYLRGNKSQMYLAQDMSGEVEQIYGVLNA